MSDRQNIAAWLPGVGAKLELGSAPMPEPGKDELLIQVGKSTTGKPQAKPFDLIRLKQ
jgi:hypothetical protein